MDEDLLHTDVRSLQPLGLRSEGYNSIFHPLRVHIFNLFTIDIQKELTLLPGHLNDKLNLVPPSLKVLGNIFELLHIGIKFFVINSWR